MRRVWSFVMRNALFTVFMTARLATRPRLSPPPTAPSGLFALPLSLFPFAHPTAQIVSLAHSIRPVNNASNRRQRRVNRPLSRNQNQAAPTPGAQVPFLVDLKSTTRIDYLAPLLPKSHRPAGMSPESTPRSEEENATEAATKVSMFPLPPLPTYLISLWLRLLSPRPRTQSKGLSNKQSVGAVDLSHA